MRKFLALAILFGAAMFAVPSAEAQSRNRADNNGNYQYQQRRNNRRYDRPVRVVTRVRTIRSGRRVFRETYQVRYFSSGKTVTRLVSRVRVR